MIIFQNKLLKLLKLASKLVNKLIFVIDKIEKTYLEAQSKVENLVLIKIDLKNVLETLNKVQEKLGEKNDKMV